MARVRFAGVACLSERGMTITFGLPRRLSHRRIQRVEHPVASWYVHYLRIIFVSELDGGAPQMTERITQDEAQAETLGHFGTSGQAELRGFVF